MGILDFLRGKKPPDGPKHYLEDIFGQPDNISINQHTIREAVQKMVTEKRKIITELWPQIPPEHQKIIEKIAAEEKEDKFKVAAEWLVQKELFQDIGEYLSLPEADNFEPNQSDGFILLTEKGSLLSTGAEDATTKIRLFDYVRIPSRRASWEAQGRSTSREGKIKETIQKGEKASVSGLRTSPVQSILVIPKARLNELPRIVQAVTHTVNSTMTRS